MKFLPLKLLVVLWVSLSCTTARAAADVVVRVDDGTRLRSVYWVAPETVRGVLLVHGENRSTKDWVHLGPKLQRAGFQVLAIGLRAQGANLPQGVTPKVLVEEDMPNLLLDVRAGLDYLKSKGVVDIAVVGADLGATLVMEAARDRLYVTNAVLLSPGMRRKGVILSGAVSEYGERPLFIAVSAEDSYSSKTALVVDSIASGKTNLSIFQGAGKGAKMLSRAPSLESEIVAWLVQRAYNSTSGDDTVKPTIISEEPGVETVGPGIGG